MLRSRVLLPKRPGCKSSFAKQQQPRDGVMLILQSCHLSVGANKVSGDGPANRQARTVYKGSNCCPVFSIQHQCTNRTPQWGINPIASSRGSPRITACTEDYYQVKNPHPGIDTYDCWQPREGCWQSQQRFLRYVPNDVAAQMLADSPLGIPAIQPLRAPRQLAPARCTQL